MQPQERLRHRADGLHTGVPRDVCRRREELRSEEAGRGHAGRLAADPLREEAEQPVRTRNEKEVEDRARKEHEADRQRIEREG